MNFDFDKIIDRRGSGAIKWDANARRNKPEGLIPMWVADMDFKSAPCILDAIKKAAEHGVFGYSEPCGDYFDILKNSLLTRHGAATKREWHVLTPGIVFALAAAIKAFTDAGDRVLIQKPVYYPFSEVINSNGRTVVNSPLVFTKDGYKIDFDDFEKKIKNGGVKLFLLCNPHNPTGRVFSKTELEKMAEICLNYGVKIVADEIWADFCYEKKHVGFLTLDKKYSDGAVVCLSPAKTFNIAGLQISDIFIQDEKSRVAFNAEVKKCGYSQLNPYALTAARAAYKDGWEWFDALLLYLKGNRGFIDGFVKSELKLTKFLKNEGTYLAWLDMRAFKLNAAELDKKTVNAGLWLDNGEIFGKEGAGFNRLNYAAPRPVLEKAMEKIKEMENGL